MQNNKLSFSEVENLVKSRITPDLKKEIEQYIKTSYRGEKFKININTIISLAFTYQYYKTDEAICKEREEIMTDKNNTDTIDICCRLVTLHDFKQGENHYLPADIKEMSCAMEQLIKEILIPFGFTLNETCKKRFTQVRVRRRNYNKNTLDTL